MLHMQQPSLQIGELMEHSPYLCIMPVLPTRPYKLFEKVSHLCYATTWVLGAHQLGRLYVVAVVTMLAGEGASAVLGGLFPSRPCSSIQPTMTHRTARSAVLIHQMCFFATGSCGASGISWSPRR